MRKITSEPQDISRKKKPEILLDIQQLEQAGQFRALRGYLIQLAKYGERPAQYESLFSKYIDSPEADLKEAALFCLLFALQIQNPAYRRVAVATLQDQAQDFDARMWAGSGLAMTYKHTKDAALLKTFLGVLDEAGTDKYLKVTLIRNILLVLGISSREQWLRAKSDSLPDLQQEFAAELVRARVLASKPLR